MGKIIYRTEKIKTAGEVSGREAEANRTSADKGRFQNSDINWELTDSNYDFKITHNWIDAVKDLCKELGCPVKKDSVLVLDHLITASPEWMKAQTEETRMQFFEDAKQWIVDEFCGGDERLLLNCRIHKDEESNWHMCAATAPIMKNPQRSEEELAQLKRKSRQKEYSLNAKAIMGGREKYGSRQQSIEDKVGKKYGLEEREVREQGQAKKHRTVQQAKLDAVNTELREAEQKRDDAVRQQEKAQSITEREQRRAKAAISSASNLERRKEAIEDLTHEAERELSFVQKKIDVAVEDGQNKVARAEYKAQELINEAEKIKAQAIATEQNLIIERQMQRMLASAYQERKKGFRGTVTLPYEEYQDMYLAYTMREESKNVLERGIAMQSKAEAQKRDIADFNMQKRILNQKEATLDERIEKAFKQGERSGQQMILKDICATLNRNGLEDISKQLCRIYDEILNPDKEMRLQGISEHDKDTHDRDDSPELGD